MLAEKYDSPYSKVMELLRCRLSFALLRSCVMFLRGARTSLWHPRCIDMVASDLATVEGLVTSEMTYI